MKRPMLFIAPLPPPLGGASKVSAAISETLTHAGAQLRVVDTSSEHLGHQRSLHYHVRRMRRIGRGLIRVLTSRRVSSTYIVPDAGLGAWYSLAFALLSSLRSPKWYFHHHSCAYIERKTLPMTLMVKLTGARAIHIFLTVGMRTAFIDVYGSVESRVIENACFTETAVVVHTAAPTVHLAHLSNLCTDKGFFRVADTFESLVSQGHNVELHLAGPILEPAVEYEIRRLNRYHANSVVYHGPLYGHEKASFFADADVFLFPTAFSQEAAPNVIYEAASQGTPCLSVNRGRIPEIVDSLGGRTCERNQSFTALVADWLGTHGKTSEGLRRDVRSNFLKQRVTAERSLARWVVEVL